MLYKFLNYIPLSFRDSTHRFYKMGLFQKKKKAKNAYSKLNVKTTYVKSP